MSEHRVLSVGMALAAFVVGSAMLGSSASALDPGTAVRAATHPGSVSAGKKKPPKGSPSSPDFVQVALNSSAAVALTRGGKVYAWGEERRVNRGQFMPSLCIGKAKVSKRSEYVPFPTGGRDEFDYRTRTSPARVVTVKGVRFTQVAAGGGFLLALSSDGAVYAWGMGPMGVSGRGKENVVACPTRVTLPAGVKITQISAGSGVVALSTAGEVYEWGELFVDLYQPSVTRRVPVRVDLPEGVRFTSVWASQSGLPLFGRTAEGALYWWVQNPYGEPGLGPKYDETLHRYYASPSLLPQPEGVVFAHALPGLALGVDGAVYAWGRNDHGQLGNGQTDDFYDWSDTAQVVALPGGAPAVGIDSSGGNFAVTGSGLVYGWGYNGSGSLGVNSRAENVVTPTSVALPADVKVTQLATGGNNAVLAVTTDGRIYGWGYNQVGILGKRLQARYPKPRLIG